MNHTNSHCKTAGRAGLLIAFILIAIVSTSAQNSVLTQDNDNARSGLNPNETTLNTSNVNVNTFGKLFSVTVDEQVHAQPLYVPNVTIPGKGVHNVLIVATENDTVYALDADSNTGVNANPLWKASLLDAAHGAAPGEIPFPENVIPACGDITPQIGVTSTPVIDVSTSPGTIFVEAVSQNGATYVHRLHALDLTTGNEKSPGPVIITGSVSGTGDESQNGVLQFDPMEVYNRSALLLLNGVVYVAFGSHCDNVPWHGWIFAYDEASFAQKSIFVTSPNAGGSGIWMSNAGLAADSTGYIYVTTGNGEFDTTPPVTDYGDTLLKLATTDAQGNNGILSVADYFTPFDQQTMFQSNQELASAGPILLPDQPGNYPHLLVLAAKTGRVYLVNRDQMTSDPSNPSQPEHYCSTCTTGDPQILQESAGAYIAGIFGSPAYWNGNIFFWGIRGPLTAISLSNGLLNFSSPSVGAASPGFPGAEPVVSANGNNSGTAIVWAITKSGLYAYDAGNLSNVLWTSAQGPNGRDNPGPFVKFSTPTVVNGKLYVGAIGEVDVYGLLPMVTPLNVTLAPAQQQQFSSDLPNVTWSISPTTLGNISASGLYTAPSTITQTQTVTVTAMNATNSAATATVTLVPSAAGASSASFVTYDTSTQGNWIGKYGADGYSLAGGNQLLPSYASTFAVRNQTTWTWASNTTDPRALQTDSHGDRIAGTWFSATTFSFDVNVTDGNSHQVALYLLDWDGQGRTETIQVLDATSPQQRVLDQEIASNLTNGSYLVWNISGHVTISVTVGGGPNGVVSGVFFGGGGSTTITATASYIGQDASTQGNWPAAYGNEGYSIANVGQNFTIPATLSMQGQLNYTWAASSTDSRALQAPSGTGRVASTWYSAASFSLDLNLTDGKSHELALYALDWDGAGRSETVQVVDAGTGSVLDTRTLNKFSGGLYTLWNISGHVQITVTLNSGPNAAISAIFLGGAGTIVAQPNLSIAKTHTGTFAQGQTNATYTVTVTNAANAGPTSGAVTVSDTLPSGLSLVSMAGTGWACTLNSCSRSDALSGGASYPAITVTVNVNAAATSPQVNQANVSGGGSAMANATDSTVVTTTNNNGGGGGNPSGNSATFLSKDTTTQGKWEGVYGADGYYLANGPTSLPAYASFTPQNQLNYTWIATTTDPRALQIPGGTGGIAATWYSGANLSYSFDLNVGSSTHTFALYALDWDNQGRSETVQIQDADTNTILDTQTASNFGNGVYLVWNISGHVEVTVTWTGGPNAVVSAAFFGGAGTFTPPPPATATYTGADVTTQGNWSGVYGSSGYVLANLGQNLLIPITTGIQNQPSWTWNPSTTDPRALQIPGGGGSAAATWFNLPTLSFDVNLTDGKQHQLAMYLLDWDNKGRAETIEIVDANSGAVLDTHGIPATDGSATSANFANGTYLKWNVSGHVTVKITTTGGPNAVLSGMFFD